MRYLDPTAMQRDLQACNKFDVSDRMKEISIPIFALVGEDDNIITPAIAKNYVQNIHHADLAVVRGANHVPMIEQPEEFNRLFLKFITWVQNNV
ncbi:MAG: alpha/beta hydrolase [Candidatus Thorarchaeota archaeon]|nr:alpha/beta hydrolase [Candidatus Thorarchaeota archaeon]